jgi:hypothetical protein
VDRVSDDCADGGDGPGVSFGVSTGNRTAAVTGGTVFLIPAAHGGTSTSEWSPPAAPFDRLTLFGSAAYRGRLAELERGAPLGYRDGDRSFGALLWYQGEADSASLAQIQGFVDRSDVIFDAFRSQLDAPIVFVQLSRRGPVPGDPDPLARNLLMQRVREAQRRMETGSRELGGGSSAVAEPGRFMVVTHDLPMSDGRHLSAEGQVELGRRISLAIRQHLLLEAVDGSGPRPVGVVQISPTQVRVQTDRPISEPVVTSDQAYAGYFAVLADGVNLGVSRIERDPDDTAAVLIALAAPTSGPVDVRYMPPPGLPSGFETGVVRSATCADPRPGTLECLPMPAFGAAAESVSLGAMEAYDFSDPR